MNLSEFLHGPIFVDLRRRLESRSEWMALPEDERERYFKSICDGIVRTVNYARSKAFTENDAFEAGMANGRMVRREIESAPHPVLGIMMFEFARSTVEAMKHAKRD